MREIGLITANYSVFTLASLTLAALQCSLWLQFFGYFPAPHVWLPTLVYWTLYRNLGESLVMVYILAFVASPLTAMPLGILLFTHICLFLVVLLIKHRFYWVGSVYFMIISGVLAALFPLFHLLFSWLFESTPITDFQFFQWIMRGLLTALVALPFFRLFRWMDRITHKELPVETGNPEL